MFGIGSVGMNKKAPYRSGAHAYRHAPTRGRHGNLARILSSVQRFRTTSTGEGGEPGPPGAAGGKGRAAGTEPLEGNGGRDTESFQPVHGTTVDRRAGEEEARGDRCGGVEGSRQHPASGTPRLSGPMDQGRCHPTQDQPRAAGGRPGEGCPACRRPRSCTATGPLERTCPVRNRMPECGYVRIWCARRTGRRQGVKVPWNEGVPKPRFSASRASVPVRGQAKRRQRRGWVRLRSTEKTMIRGAEVFRSAEGTIAGIELVRCRRAPRCPRTPTRPYVFGWDPGRSSSGPAGRGGTA